MPVKETINRAYGNTPRDLPDPFSWTDDFLPRTFKYFWLRWIVRRYFR